MSEDIKQKRLQYLADHLENVAVIYETLLQQQLNNSVDAYNSGWKALFRRDLSSVFNEMTEHKNFTAVFQEKGFQNCVSAGYPIKVDGAEFTREELETVADKFKALHDLGLKYNVSIRLAGFDNLPRENTAVGGTYSDDRCVLVALDSSERYYVYEHPEYNSDTARELKARLNSFEQPKV